MTASRRGFIFQNLFLKPEEKEDKKGRIKCGGVLRDTTVNLEDRTFFGLRMFPGIARLSSS
jgi:hypothetical protein